MYESIVLFFFLLDSASWKLQGSVLGSQARSTANGESALCLQAKGGVRSSIVLLFF